LNWVLKLSRIQTIDETRENLGLIIKASQGISVQGLERIPVDSSNIGSVGYDEDEEMLEVEFLNGTIYEYEGVPREVYEELMRASSHGSYFYWSIRMEYPYRRIV